MTDDALNTPTPEFRAQLEWEVARALRREESLGASRRERHRRRLRVAGLVAVCIATGSASGFASAQVRDVARRDSLIDAERAEQSMIKLRLDLARARFADANRRYAVGAAGPEEVAQAEAELHAVEARSRRTQLNLEEIRLASLAPRDELNAPLVGGRDFVKERIQLQLSMAQQQLIAAEKAAAEAERRVRVGVESEAVAGAARLSAAMARAELGVDAERLALRREFVERGTAPEQLVKRLEAAQLRFDLMVAQQSLELAKLRFTQAARQHAVGATTELTLLRARVDLKERELELTQLAERLRLLGAVRRDSVPQ